MEANTQSRKWLLVINHPAEAGLDHTTIAKTLHLFKPTYFCMADEIATTGTPHTHVFFYAPSPARFSTVKKRFPTAHIEKAFGSSSENRDYIRKEGNWAETEKAETAVLGSFEEWGELPTEQAEKNPAMSNLLESIASGMTNLEIIQENPSFAFRTKEMDNLRQLIRAEKFTTQNRELTVTYLYGASGTGKTRSIYASHEASEICRITNYGGARGISFDAYQMQTVLVFEEFYQQIPLSDMLNYLDMYPLYLPARYNDRVACYQEVYITSNYPLSYQYSSVQAKNPKAWQAFFRRIHNIVEFTSDGSTVIHKGNFDCATRKKEEANYV